MTGANVNRNSIIGIFFSIISLLLCQRSDAAFVSNERATCLIRSKNVHNNNNVRNQNQPVTFIKEFNIRSKYGLPSNDVPFRLHSLGPHFSNRMKQQNENTNKSNCRKSQTISLLSTTNKILQSKDDCNIRKKSKSKSKSNLFQLILSDMKTPSSFIVAIFFVFFSMTTPMNNALAISSSSSSSSLSSSEMTTKQSTSITQTSIASLAPDPIKNTKINNKVNPYSDSVLDEVWSLVDKYYIDRSFHGQDWKAVLDDYHSKMSSSNNDNIMQLTTQMVATLGDKYSRMLETEAYVNIQKFDLIGVGATFMPDSYKRIIVGSPPLQGSAADLAGIQSGDYIDAVNGIKTEGRTAFDIIDQIGDDPNAKEITLTVRQMGENDLIGEGTSRDVVLQRTFTKVKDPIVYKISERRKDGTIVGYIRITEFNALVKRQLEDALKQLESQGVNAYVLDLRGNPGGAFQSAVEIASYFIDDAVATFVVDNNQVELPFRTAKGKVLIDKSDPISVWVDRRSASASEVLAGALRDNCRGVIMGETSFGKGLIQAVYGLKNGAGLVLTVARYVTPNGTNIQGTGITPDLEGGVPSSFLQSMVTIINGDTTHVDFGAVQAKSKEICEVNNK